MASPAPASAPAPAPAPPGSTSAPSEDIFQCGCCRRAFTSLALFYHHKRAPCSAPALAPAPAPAPAPSSAPRPAPQASCASSNKKLKRPSGLPLQARPYQCLVCGKCFTQSTHLQRHLPAHRVWPDGLSRTVPGPGGDGAARPDCYACSYCAAVLPDYARFRIHLKTHNDRKLYKCIQGDCTSVFADLEPLLRHVREDHSDAIYHCQFCSFSHGAPEGLARHQQDHDKSTKAQKIKSKHDCPRCDASFSKQEKLTFHMATHIHVSTCTLCDKTFSSEKRLRSHLRTHGPVKSFHCNVCSASFVLKKYLASHILKHGERQFTCTLCSLKFKRKDLLNRHLKIHKSRQKLVCPFKEQLGCKLQFSRNDKLKLHLKSHVKRLIDKSKSCKTNNKTSISTVEIVIIPVNSDEQGILDISK